MNIHRSFWGPAAIMTVLNASQIPVMSRIAPKDYLLTLCTTVQEANKSFSVAVRIGMSDLKFNIESTKVIHSILTFSPAPDLMAAEFLNKLERVSGMADLHR